MIHSDKFRVTDGFHGFIQLECRICSGENWSYRIIDSFDGGIGLGHLISKAEAHWYKEHAEQEQ